MSRNLAVVFSTIILSAFAFSAQPAHAQKAKHASKVAMSAPPAASGCDASLWNHVYNPKRLQQVSPCASVTGVITESNPDPDGDQHLLLKLDPGQGNLTNKRNAKKKGGDIVIEFVCANPTSLKKAKGACVGYANRIPIPKVGAHVRVTGTYVLDSHNGWTEIHPVSKIDAM
jgi:hypothetical protein